MNESTRESTLNFTQKEILEADHRTMLKVRRILKNGNNAEIKQRADGSIAVYEVKKTMVKN